MTALNPQTLLGKTEIQAASDALINGVQVRIVQRDGASLPITEDYSPNRWDLEVESGVVVGVRLPQVQK